MAEDSNQFNNAAAIAGGVSGAVATKRLLEKADTLRFDEVPNGYSYEKGSSLDRLNHAMNVSPAVSAKYWAARDQAKNEASEISQDAKLIKRAKRSEAAKIALEDKNLTGAASQYKKMIELESAVKEELLKNDPSYANDLSRLEDASYKHSQLREAAKNFDQAIASHLEKTEPELMAAHGIDKDRGIIAKGLEHIPTGKARVAVIAGVGLTAAYAAGKAFSHKPHVERLREQTANENLRGQGAAVA